MLTSAFQRVLIEKDKNCISKFMTKLTKIKIVILVHIPVCIWKRVDPM